MQWFHNHIPVWYKAFYSLSSMHTNWIKVKEIKFPPINMQQNAIKMKRDSGALPDRQFHNMNNPLFAHQGLVHSEDAKQQLLACSFLRHRQMDLRILCISHMMDEIGDFFRPEVLYRLCNGRNNCIEHQISPGNLFNLKGKSKPYQA